MKFVAAVTAAVLVMVPTVSFAQGAGGEGSGAGGAGSGAGSDMSGTGTSGTGTVPPSQRSGNPSEVGINNNSIPGTGQGGGR
jgi:hypothetical protein